MADRSVPSVDQMVKSTFPLKGPGGPPPVRRKPNRKKRAVPYGLAGPAVIYLAFFFLIPIALMFLMSLKSGAPGSFQFKFTFPGQWSNYTDGWKYYNHQLVRSIGYALIVTAATLLLSYPMAYWIAFYGGKRKSTFLFLILLPFFVSFVIRTVQWSFILGDNGILLGTLKHLGLVSQDFHILSTPLAVIAGITYNFLPFTALPLYVSLERIDPRLLEAGRDLYANRWTTFRKVVWPLALPGVFAAFLLTFVPAVGDYVNASILGGPQTTMIGNIIQGQFLTNANYPLASALSFILMAILLVGATLYARILGTDAVMEVSGG